MKLAINREELARGLGRIQAIVERRGTLPILANALIHDPDILLFDEPTTGLDPLGRNEVLDAMKAFADKGKTVLFSTHILSDVEKICDKVGIIHEGLLIEQGSPEELRQKHGAKDLDEVFLKVARHG